jgi:hypothetical protein
MTMGAVYPLINGRIPVPAHTSTHENGGSDEVSVTGLSGLLADDQHVLDAEVYARGLVVSDTLRNSNDTQRDQTGNGVYTKKKETKLNANLSAVRIKFDGYTDIEGPKARLYKNGVAIGTERTLATSWTTYSEDFSGFVANDLIQVYVQGEAAKTASVKNLRFYYSYQLTVIGLDTLSTPLAVTTDPTISMTNQDP